MNKKLVCIFLAALMAIGMTATGFTAAAETYGDFVYTVNTGGTVTILKYTGSQAEVEIPSEIEGYPVKTIQSFLFSRCYFLKEITIPDSVEVIHLKAFENCTNLKSVTIPDGVTEIDKFTFFNCTALTSVVLPDTVTKIGESAFENCNLLESIEIPDGVTSIGENAFYYCTSLKTFSLPESIESVSPSAFYETGYYNDKSNWENGALYIDDCLISVKELSGEYTVKPGTRLIAEEAFKLCGEIDSIIIPNSVEIINEMAFHGTGYYINESNWENGALYVGDCLIYARNVTGEYMVKPGTRLIADGAFRDTKATSVTVCDSVTDIGKNAFYNSYSLRSVTILGSVSKIRDWTFYRCFYLNKVVIQEGVESIGAFAFAYCDHLHELVIPKSVTYIDKYTFAYRPADFLIYGYKGSYAEDYATRFHIKFVPLSESGNVLGDLDGSKSVDVNDLSALKSLILADCKEGDMFIRGDIDNNGVLDVNDLSALKSMIMSAQAQ